MSQNDLGDEAACYGLVSGWKLFFEDDRDETPKYFYPYENQAKAICASCVVKEECLQMALDNDEKWGIWGGLTYPQRRKLLRGLHVER